MLFGYLLLGILAGLAGVVFNHSLLASLRIADRAHNWPRGAEGRVGWHRRWIDRLVRPECRRWGRRPRTSGGLFAIRLGLHRHNSWYPVYPYALFIRLRGTGGIFAPLLALGALLGNGYASFEAVIFHHSLDPAPYAIVAMAALFTSVVRSPLTGVVLLLEMTGSWTLILPMMAASVTAYSVPELLGVDPIYDSLRRRDEAMEHGQPEATAPSGPPAER